MAINLDIGHYTAAGADPVDLLRKRHDDIIDLHIKDRKKNNGPNVLLGEGDTPVRDVLLLLRDQKWRIPANLEWEVNDDRVAAVKQAFIYCRNVLQP